jgi:heptosyltransferase I
MSAPPAREPASIAVLRLSALGDVVMTLPLLRTLQKAFPRTKLYWLVSRPFEPIVRGIPGISARCARTSSTGCWCRRRACAPTS